MLNLNNPKTIKKLREQIDEIDKKLLRILAERFRVTQRVGEYKKRHKLPALDKKREKEIFQKRELLAKKLNLDPLLVKQIFTLIIENVKKRHREIKKEE
ncbi:chorismate mutase [bacterium]|nr:chorismate mutase [bacterium]